VRSDFGYLAFDSTHSLGFDLAAINFALRWRRYNFAKRECVALVADGGGGGGRGGWGIDSYLTFHDGDCPNGLGICKRPLVEAVGFKSLVDELTRLSPDFSTSTPAKGPLPPPAGLTNAPPFNFLFEENSVSDYDPGSKSLQIDMKEAYVISALVLRIHRDKWLKSFNLEYVPWTVLDEDAWESLDPLDTVRMAMKASSMSDLRVALHRIRGLRRQQAAERTRHSQDPLAAAGEDQQAEVDRQREREGDRLGLGLARLDGGGAVWLESVHGPNYEDLE